MSMFELDMDAVQVYNLTRLAKIGGGQIPFFICLFLTTFL